MSATNSLENGLLALLFNGTTITALADNTATTPATSFWISLHTASPGEAGDQTTSETSYTGYARQELVRDGTGFTVSGNSVINAASAEFGLCTALPTPQTLTHFGIGLDETGAGTLLFYAALNNSIAMQVNFSPLFPAGELSATAD